MIDKIALSNDLTEAFVNYQYRLEHPMPSATETPATMIEKYRSDPLFHTRVKSLVSGVMQIIEKHIE